MKGTLYGVGVGPGDPELLTLKAVRVIESCQVVAAPESGSGDMLALEIAAAHIGDKPVVRCPMPMTRDQEELRRYHRKSADLITEQLDKGNSVAFLTLGDPAIYSTYLYLHRLIKADGYAAELVPGIPSFCAAAAALDVPLCEQAQPLHIIPGSYQGVEQALALDGTKVLMKSGKQLGRVLELLRERELLPHAVLAQRCGLPGQELVHELEGWEPNHEYFSLVIVGEGAGE